MTPPMGLCGWDPQHSKGKQQMRAELIIDLNDLGTEIGKSLGREDVVYPSLGTVAELWSALGIEVSAIRLVAPAFTNDAEDSFASRHQDAWWTTEQAFLDDYNFDVIMRYSPTGESGPIAIDELVTTIALSRSDAFASDDDQAVIVMSNSPGVAPAVSHARGASVLIAGTIIHDSGLAHTRLDLSWMGLLKNRFTAISLPDVELRNGRPWSGDIAVSTPYGGTEGRDLELATLPSFAESVAIFDPAYFEITEGSDSISPRDAGVAAVVHTLGLGALLHIEDVSVYTGSPTTISAAIYRFAADHPDIPIVLASSRPSIIALSSDLDSFGIMHPQRVLRLCMTERQSSFDETAFATDSAACRIVIEQTLTDPLFATGDEVIDIDQHNAAMAAAAAAGGVAALAEYGEVSSPSPTLTLYANPNTIRETSENWREENKRRFLLLGATGAEATPADSSEGVFLPISLGGCTDFLVRRPALRPGCIVEGVLHRDGGRWVIVSDPIERRRRKRAKNTVPVTPETETSAAA